MKDRKALRAVEVAAGVLVVFLSFIGVAGSITHLLDGTMRIGDVPGFRQTSEHLYGVDFTPHWYDFRQIPLTRAAHMGPGLIWMLFAPLQLVPAIRRRFPAFHRWVGRIAISMTLILIPSGLVFAARHPFAGAFQELVPIVFYTVLYVVSVGLGLKNAWQRNYARHREWMLRAFAIGIGISSVRLWFLLFLHTTGMPAQQFFPTAFWVAFAVNLVIVEVWINVTRESARSAVMPPSTSVAPAQSAMDWAVQEARQ